MVNHLRGLVGANKKEVPPPPVSVEELKDEVKTVSYEEFMRMASDKLEPVTSRGKILLEKAKESDQTQHKVIAAGRTVFDVTAIAIGPAGGAVGGIVGCLDPEATKQVCDKIDLATRGVWNDLSFEQKLLGLGSGVGVGVLSWYFYIPVLTYLVITVANVYAAKRGADFAVRNYRSEGDLHKQKKLLEEVSDDDKLD